MLTNKQLSQLVYFDRDFISARYEIFTGESSLTQITRAEGLQAGVKIPMFNAGATTMETKSFAISTLEMLALLTPCLRDEADLNSANFNLDMPSMTGWVNGRLSAVRVKETNIAGESLSEPQSCFTLRNGSSLNLALITTPDYFVSGLDAFTKMQHVLLRDLSIPVRALVRVVAAQNHADQWIAVPYLMVEPDA